MPQKQINRQLKNEIDAIKIRKFNKEFKLRMETSQFKDDQINFYIDDYFDLEMQQELLTCKTSFGFEEEQEEEEIYP